MGREILVGIAELKAGDKGDTLISLGLGSCVAVALFDREQYIGSLAHIMLPLKESGRRRDGENMNKYADIAIPASLRLLESLGGSRLRISARIAGGACMFDLSKDGQPDIGRRNVDITRNILGDLRIPIVGEDTGGNRGRSVRFRLGTGEFVVRTVRGEERIL